MTGGQKLRFLLLTVVIFSEFLSVPLL